MLLTLNRLHFSWYYWLPKFLLLSYTCDGIKDAFLKASTKMRKAHSRTSHFNVQQWNPKATETKYSKYSFVRWRNCRLNSSNSTGSECCLQFEIFSQPMVRVTIIHDWVTLYLSLMYFITKKTCNENLSQISLRNFHTCTIWSKNQNCYSSA